MAKELKRS